MATVYVNTLHHGDTAKLILQQQRVVSAVPFNHLLILDFLTTQWSEFIQDTAVRINKNTNTKIPISLTSFLIIIPN